MIHASNDGPGIAPDEDAGDVWVYPPGFARRPESANPSGEALRRLVAGEITMAYAVIPGKTSSVYHCLGAVHGTVDQLLGYYTDPDNTPRYQDTVREQRVLENSPTQKVVEYLIALPWPLGQRRLTLRFAIDPAAQTMTWHRLAGTMREHRGFLALKALSPLQTLVTYQLEVDFDTFLPPVLMAWANSMILPSVIKAARRDLHQTHR